MTLHIEKMGEGPDIVFLHGWAMNLEIWRDIAISLSKTYCVTLIDLPGFGLSKNIDSTISNETITTESITLDILVHIPDGAVLVGWSMGGLVALNIALQHPHKIKKLILVACNARFTISKEWPHAMHKNILQGFESSLTKNFQQTLQRFLMLQVRGTEHARETAKALKHSLLQSGEPDETALYDGLQILKNSDYVNQLDELKMPVLLMFGRLDSLVPVAVAESMLNRIVDAEMVIFPHAAHAPFLSHEEDFLAVINQFLVK